MIAKAVLILALLAPNTVGTWFDGACTVTRSGTNMNVHKDGVTYSLTEAGDSVTFTSDGPFQLEVIHHRDQIEWFDGEAVGCEPETTTTTEMPEDTTTTTEVEESTTTTQVETTTTLSTTTTEGATDTTSTVPPTDAPSITNPSNTSSTVEVPESVTTTKAPEFCLPDPDSPTGQTNSETGNPCLPVTGVSLEWFVALTLALGGIGVALLAGFTVAMIRRQRA